MRSDVFALPLCTLRALFSLTHRVMGEAVLTPPAERKALWESLFTWSNYIYPWNGVEFGASCEDIHFHSAEHKIKKQLVI